MLNDDIHAVNISKLNLWMDGWMDEYIDGWMDGWMNI